MVMEEAAQDVKVEVEWIFRIICFLLKEARVTAEHNLARHHKQPSVRQA
jgi:hypothetical protein